MQLIRRSASAIAVAWFLSYAAVLVITATVIGSLPASACACARAAGGACPMHATGNRASCRWGNAARPLPISGWFTPGPIGIRTTAALFLDFTPSTTLPPDRIAPPGGDDVRPPLPPPRG